ncbi:MAG: hypothetical protein QM809_11655 [Gordonia sp. (in: high G+C Gram-positive bacteria)]|uniref:LppM family (lipo)protein n=1 Tax=Gordonia sp. (in: high G+C Gram-positive bacteria) TaxID=84139 RepID=UPI0039E45845
MPSLLRRPDHGHPDRRRARRLPVLAVVALLTLVPLLGGCMTRSEHVGDQYSGYIIVAATSASSPTRPTFDVPNSMLGSIGITDFSAEKGAAADSPSAGKVGSQLTYSNLSAGQFAQLGDIVSTALGHGATVDLSATRSGSIVRLRGGASLTELSPRNDYLSITVDFGGPVVATNGERAGENSINWTPEPGQNADFNADAEYPDPATAALPSWTWLMVLSCLAVSGLVAAAAYRSRDRTPRYVDPERANAPQSAWHPRRILEAIEKRRSGTGAKKKTDDDAPEAETGDDDEPASAESATAQRD